MISTLLFCRMIYPSRSHKMKKCLLLFCLLCFTIISAQQTSVSYYSNAAYDSAIPAPKDVLGFEIGERCCSTIFSNSNLKALIKSSLYIFIIPYGYPVMNHIRFHPYWMICLDYTCEDYWYQKKKLSSINCTGFTRVAGV